MWGLPKYCRINLMCSPGKLSRRWGSPEERRGHGLRSGRVRPILGSRHSTAHTGPGWGRGARAWPGLVMAWEGGTGQVGWGQPQKGIVRSFSPWHSDHEAKRVRCCRALASTPWGCQQSRLRAESLLFFGNTSRWQPSYFPPPVHYPDTQQDKPEQLAAHLAGKVDAWLSVHPRDTAMAPCRRTSESQCLPGHGSRSLRCENRHGGILGVRHRGLCAPRLAAITWRRSSRLLMEDRVVWASGQAASRPHGFPSC